MIVFAAFFFLLAAFMGVFLLRSLLKNKRTYKPVVFMHGCVAGLALLIMATYVALGHTAPLLIASLVLFIVTAVGGLTMFTLDTSGKRVPKAIAIGHPILAMTSIVILIIYIVQNS